MTPIKQFEDKYRFLSNFWPSEIVYEKEKYPTIEHAFQAAKTTSEEERRIVRACKTPGQSKRAGRKVTLRKDWEDVKIGVMYSLVKQKFVQQDLRKQLLATGDAELVEGNNWGDKFWGIDLETEEGKNHLGKILMDIRREIQTI